MIERNLFGNLVTKITSKRFLVKFDSFQRPLPTLSFVAVSPELFVFEQVSGAFKRFSPSLVKNVFCPKKTLFCFLVIKTISKLFSVCFNSF